LLLDAPTVLDGRLSTGEGLRSEPEDATADSEVEGWRLIIERNASGENIID